MVVRDVYTKAEEDMLATFREGDGRMVGWLPELAAKDHSYPIEGRLMHRVASKELILHYVYATGLCRNPLWSDENYARNTRWGGLIAPPFFQHALSGEGSAFPFRVPPDAGTIVSGIIGEEFEYFRPIYVNDSFKIWRGPSKIVDITRPGEQTERRFKFSIPCLTLINQRDEVVGTFNKTRVFTILPPGVEVGDICRPGAEQFMAEVKNYKMKFAESYVYTKDEVEAIDRIYATEEIRGPKIRYWEDVEVGEELKPIVMGPLTILDMAIEMGAYGVIEANLPWMEQRRVKFRYVTDPVTNVPQHPIQWHLSNDIPKMMGFSSGTLHHLTIEGFLGRLITNWMGDDGFLRKFSWNKLNNTPFGDSIIGNGKVTKKYIDENGDHLVDIDTWMETIRGYISNACPATVSLLSREEVFNHKWPFNYKWPVPRGTR